MATIDELVNQVADLTTATTDLLEEVGDQKDRLTTAASAAEQKSIEAGVSATEASQSVMDAAAEVTKATNQANIAANEADRAKDEADRASEITGLDTVEEAVDLALGEFAGMMTESEARAINRINKVKYDASGMVNAGNAIATSSMTPVNEGISAYTAQSNVIVMGATKACPTANRIGSSKTLFPVTHIAGAVINIMGVRKSGTWEENKLQLPEAEDGTRIYDSTGDARGSGNASLDLKVDVDPKYGDVPTGTEAQILREAVGRAFEGVLINGDFRLGNNDPVNGWRPAQNGAMVWNSDSTITLSSDNAGVVAKSPQYFSGRIPDVAEIEVTVSVGATTNTTDREGRIYITGLGNMSLPENETTTFTFTSSDGAKYVELQSDSQPDATVVINSVSVRVVTEEVVTHRVDGIFLEYYEEELTGRQEVLECIQSLSTTFGDTDVSTVLSTRKLSYFQQYDGQFPEVTADPDFVNDRYRCVVWSDLTDEEKRKVAAYMGEKLFMGVNGNIVNGRLRARTIRGAGNGDWGSIDASVETAYLDWSTTNPTLHIRPQGSADTIGVMGSGYPVYSSRRDGVAEHPDVQNTQGVFGAMQSANSPSLNLAYQGRCFMYVVATVPRANQGAYVEGLNEHGTRSCNATNGASTGRQWHHSEALTPLTTAECFRVLDATSDNATRGAAQASGAIGTYSGHPDGIFYDGIEVGGLNGVIDWRLGAVANDSPEEAAKVEAKVENSTYRGLEKLVWTKVVEPSTILTGDNADFATVGADLKRFSIGYDVHIGATVYVNGTAYTVASLDGSSKRQGQFSTDIDVTGCTVVPNTSSWDVYSAPIRTVVTVETSLSVSGEFNTQMVIGDPANILLTDAIKDGWLGTWCPVITTDSAETYPYSRKVLDGTRNVFTENYGVSWSASASWDNNFDSVDNSITRAASIDGGRVYIVWYKAFAKQTKPSTNKAVYNTKAGLLGVTVTQSYDKSVLAEAVAGVILKSDASGIVTEQSSPVKFLVDEAIERITSLTSDMVAPTNNSQAIKIAIYQISENGQVSLGFIANTMTHNGTDWGELDEIIIPFGDLEVDTFNDANGIPQTAQSTMSAIPHGWASNHARAGVQVPGVDL